MKPVLMPPMRFVIFICVPVGCFVFIFGVSFNIFDLVSYYEQVDRLRKFYCVFESDRSIWIFWFFNVGYLLRFIYVIYKFYVFLSWLLAFFIEMKIKEHKFEVITETLIAFKLSRQWIINRNFKFIKTFIINSEINFYDIKLFLIEESIYNLQFRVVFNSISISCRFFFKHND